ncbi:MAG: DUF5000 domain-containing lipoprotein [Arachidicoccus sp.]|nr:DUF5000 domain-containing lipoprotein [Arachidicoccus sp.]
MYHKLMYFWIVLFPVLLAGCKADVIGPITSDNKAPGPVSNVKATSGPGTVTLTYTLPSDENLLYVEAKYALNDGEEKVVKSSYYSSTMTLEGFGDTLEHAIRLYSVNKSEVASKDAVSVTAKAAENSIWEVFRSLSVIPDFAGIRIQATNKTRSNVVIQVLKDSLGEWYPYEAVYTSTDSINQAIRGLDTIAKKFAFYVRDKFQNNTDTLFSTLTPLYETTIPKSGYKSYPLPGDAAVQWSSTAISNLWDGYTQLWPYVCVSGPVTTLTPHYWTIDIGETAQLSRIIIWDYPEYLNSGRAYYYAGDPYIFEVWGSPNPPLDGSWNNWSLLGHYQEVKPSGSAYGTWTDEDYSEAAAGFSWDFNVNVPKMRYIRIKCIKNWSGTSYMSLGEIQVYGDPR